MSVFTRLLSTVIILLALISFVLGVINLVMFNETLWLFMGVGFIWLSILLQIVEKSAPEERY